VNRKNLYLLLCVLGIILPYSQFVPWVLENGLHFGLLVRQLFANRISGFLDLMSWFRPWSSWDSFVPKGGVSRYGGSGCPSWGC
jgi:hypothetical protein